MTRQLHTLVLTAGLCLSGVTRAQAVPTTQPPQGSAAVRVMKLTIGPAGSPDPALKYLLMPDYLEQTPGNAAQMYYMAAQRAEVLKGSYEVYNKIADWLEVPVEQLPREEVEQTLEQVKDALRCVELASRYEWCQWDCAVRSEGFSALLPSLLPHRCLAKALALRARLALADGRYEDALRDLQTGFAMARHIGCGPTLIHGLVGAALGAYMAQQVEDWAATPGSPNLYWALADLPRPFIDTHRMFQIERVALFFEIPELQSLRTTVLTPQQLDTLAEKVASVTTVLDQKEGPPVQVPWRQEAVIAQLYPWAKQYLLSQGYAPDQVEAMPALQVVLIQSFDRYLRIRDEMFKWFGFPYWQARDGLARIESKISHMHALDLYRHLSERQLTPPGLPRRPIHEELARAERELERILERRDKVNADVGYPFIDVLPSLGRARFLFARVDRDAAALQCIEAIRIYAAGHDGRLPASLEEIEETPAPYDPVTGKPFIYECSGDRATILAPAPPGQNGVRYELTMRSRSSQP